CDRTPMTGIDRHHHVAWCRPAQFGERPPGPDRNEFVIRLVSRTQPRIALRVSKDSPLLQLFEAFAFAAFRHASCRDRARIADDSECDREYPTDLARLDVGLNDRCALADEGIVEQGRCETKAGPECEDEISFQPEFLGRGGASRAQLSEKQPMVVR